MKKWQELSEAHRRMIEVACDANLTWSFVTSEARQFGAMRDLVEKHGVARDPDFKRAHESYAAFRKQYAIWREHGYLK